MNWSDLYSNQSTRAGTFPGTNVATGTQQTIVTQPGQVTPTSGGSAAFSWLGLVLALIIMRVLIQMGGRVA